MDVNARINWTSGMELDAGTFKALDENLHYRRVLSFKVASANRYGVLPGTVFHAGGVFASGKFEVPRLECTALLPSGEILCINEPFSVPLTTLRPGEYLVCLGLSDKNITFEKENVEYIRPEYTSAILDIDELNGKDVMPIAKFVVKDGVCNIDPGYIPPCFTVDSFAKFKELKQRGEELLASIIGHANMAEGDGKATFLRCLFRLRSITSGGDVEDVINLAEKAAGAAEYFIIGNYEGDKPIRPLVARYDIAAGLEAVCSYLRFAVSVLEQTPLVDDSVDYDKLKEEITRELYGRMMPELTEKLLGDLRQKLSEDIDAKLAQVLKEYLDGTFRRQLEEALKVSISEELASKLYDSLYKALYDALHPKEEVVEKVYVPNI